MVFVLTLRDVVGLAFALLVLCVLAGTFFEKWRDERRRRKLRNE